MTPISPSKYTDLLDRFQRLSEETEATRQEIVTQYEQLWLEHLDLLKLLADAQADNIRRGATHA